MAERDQIIEFCNELLEVDAFVDYGPNGLQVPGSTEVRRIATAVSAHLASIEAALGVGAEMLLTHHGLFWDFHPRVLSEQMADRLRPALANGLSIAGYHLPLDAHPEIGNNALLAEALGLEVDLDRRFAAVKGREIGVIGRSKEGISPDRLYALLTETLDREPLRQGAGPERIHTVGIVTGSATGEIHEAIALGLDAYITGEPAEHVLADATEGGIHFYAAGHYATEVAGIKRLGELVAKRFDLDHSFLDLPNPV